MDDDETMRGLSSANVACGFHAGDPSSILATLQQAAVRGAWLVRMCPIPTRSASGNMDVTSAELTADVIYQIGALQG